MSEDGEGLLLRIGAASARPPATSRAGDKRGAIATAAIELFLAQGYQATSTEQIATTAAVSKQTVYNQFGDKESLFREIVLGVSASSDAFVTAMAEDLGAVDTADAVGPALRALARRYRAAVANPQVLAMRRLVVSEAGRFPDLASAYYDRVPGRVLAGLATQLGRLARDGLLTITGPGGPDAAARDLAFLLIGPLLDEGMFRPLENRSVDHEADRAVQIFLAAYGPAAE